MSIWYNDPQPTQRVPRLPVAALTTGSQPPRIAVAGAIALACVLASATPAAGEPRLTQQNLHPQQSAGIIPPPPVNPPPRIGTSGQTGRVLVWSWPSEGEPRRNQPNPGASRIVPLTLKYGSQPPVSSFVLPAELGAIRTTWEPLPLTPPVPLKVTAGAIAVVSFVPYTRTPVAGDVAPPLVPRLVTAPLASVDQPAPAGRVVRPGTGLELPLSIRSAGIASLIPVSVTAWGPVAPRAPLWWSDATRAQMPGLVAAIVPPTVSSVVAFTRARVPVALDWIAPSTVRVVTQGSTPAAFSQTTYTRVLVIGAGDAPMEQRAISGARIASLIPTSVSAADLTLLGTFVQIVPTALVALTTPNATVALLVVGAVVALATPNVAAALTSPDQRIIPAPLQTSRPDL